MISFTKIGTFGTITLNAIAMGNDYSISIYGGDKPHIGAVAFAVPRKSLNTPDKVSATASVLTAVGHMEDLLARALSLKLSSTLNCHIVVSIGIHVDEANKQTLEDINKTCHDLCDDFLCRMEGDSL